MSKERRTFDHGDQKLHNSKFLVHHSLFSFTKLWSLGFMAPFRGLPHTTCSAGGMICRNGFPSEMSIKSEKSRFPFARKKSFHYNKVLLKP